MASQEIYLVCPSDLDAHAYRLLLHDLGHPPQVVSGIDFRDVRACLRHRPDILLLVADRPEPRMRDLCDCARHDVPGIRLIVVTPGSDPVLLRSWAALQPTGMVCRMAGAEMLVRAIEVVQAGGFYVDTTQDEASAAFAEAAPMPLLSERERELLPLLARGMSLRAAARSMEVHYKTADTLRTRLFRKLGVSNRVELSRYAVRSQILDP